MQPCLRVFAQRKYLTLRDGDVRTGRHIVAIMIQRYDGIESVIAPDELHQHQDMVIVGSACQRIHKRQVREGVDLEPSQKGHRRNGSYKVSTSHMDIVKSDL